MKKYFKTTWPYIILVLVLAVLLYAKWDQPVINKKEDPHKAIATVVKEYEDKFGQQHKAIDKNANTIKPKDLEDPTKSPGFVDTASQALKIARTEIDQLTKANFVVKQEKLALVKSNDSLGELVHEYRSKYLWVQFYPKGSEKYPDGYMNYRYNGNINIVDYTKETKLLGMTLKKRSYTDFYFDDPNAYVTNDIKRLTVEKGEPEKSLKINAYSQYDVQNNSFGYGPGIRIEKGPIDIGLNQVYWPQLKSWSTLVNANFTIKSF